MECCDGACRPSVCRAGAEVPLSTSFGEQGVLGKCWHTEVKDRSSSTIRLPAQLTEPSTIWPMYDTQPVASILSGHVAAEDVSVTVSMSQEQPESLNAHSAVMSAHKDNDTDHPGRRTASIEDHISSAGPYSHPSSSTTTIAQPSSSLSFQKLKLLLSMTTTESLRMDQPIPTANTIRSLYQSSKARSQIYGLSPDLMSSLISIFGALSLSTTGRAYNSIHSHPLAQRILDNEQPRTYWSFIAQLVGDKCRANMKLSPADHFWMMHVLLGQLRGVGSEGGLHGE